MAENKRHLQATPEQLWEVLSDGWLYPLWVVGASRMREVDPEWPAVGSRLHHSVGVWPALINDYTEVVEMRPGQLLALRARAWPMGEARVDITWERVGDQTQVAIAEDATSGPGLLVPSLARDRSLKWRNSESLRRLAFIAERRR